MNTVRLSMRSYQFIVSLKGAHCISFLQAMLFSDFVGLMGGKYILSAEKTFFIGVS